ncbi:hypothetical protein [Flammeovirga aprica]|uniref:Uncharacterized protein n=1 Tax=Flammeovirga aprica JL-4 TaxID=694437 RepID=A0A7X9RWL4_9BACT|nr:hypothetical protein [Flammeovirga aprica]NME70040.1 hypothetical protein [Flammeovirga aprica JL-4]
MQATQHIVEMENKLLDLYEKQNNHLLINRVLLAMMVLSPLYEIYLHYTYKNFPLLGVYLLMIFVYLMGAYFFDQYLVKTLAGVVCSILLLEVVAVMMLQEPPSLLCIQFKFFVLFGLLKVYFNARKIAAVKKDVQFSKAEIRLIREQMDNNYKKRLRGLSVYVNPQYY